MYPLPTCTQRRQLLYRYIQHLHDFGLCSAQFSNTFLAKGSALDLYICKASDCNAHSCIDGQK